MSKRLCKTLTLPDGKRKYIYGYTREELEQKYQQAKLELSAGVDISDHTTFGTFAQMWFDATKKGTMKPQSEVVIKSRINTHIMPVLAELELKKITPMICSKVFSNMTEKGLSSRTQQTVHGIMKNIFDTAVDNGLILRSPMTSSVKPHGKKAKKREAITTAEAMELVEAMRKYDYQEYCIATIALYTGMRIGEIMSLKWSDIDLEEKIIHVRSTMIRVGNGELQRQEHTKSESGMRDIPYGDRVSKCFLTLKLMYSTDWVLNNPDHKLYTRFKDHLKRENPSVTPHVLRHTAITRWIVDEGMDVKEAQYLAGHANISITYNIYTSYVKESQFDNTAKKIRSIG